MTIIVEDGSGVKGANAGTTVADVTAYLTDRNRQTENGWDSATTAAQEAAVIAGTDFIEQRFRQRFAGSLLFTNLNTARTVLNLTQQPADGETVTLGSDVFTFRNTPSLTNDVEIGDNTDASLENLISKVNEVSTVLSAGFFTGDGVLIYAKNPGTPGNGYATTTTITGASFTFATTRGGGDDDAPQELSFPRANLVTPDGATIRGMPPRYKQAIAEYAVRALSGVLQADITPDSSGRVVTRTRVKVGPIETETGLKEDGSIQLAIYPAADALLSTFMTAAGGAIR